MDMRDCACGVVWSEKETRPDMRSVHNIKMKRK